MANEIHEPFWGTTSTPGGGSGVTSPPQTSGTPWSSWWVGPQEPFGTVLNPPQTTGSPLREADPRERLYDLHEHLTDSAFMLMQKKNLDYATSKDPFRNFRSFGLLGVVVRLSDKIARLHSLVERGLDNNAVKDESYLDTLLDIINYAVIFGAMAEEERKK